ncbi:MAG TPA: hypothetical protein V6D05_06510 [Stenomitos sp.]
MTGRLMALLVPLAMIGALVAAPSALASEKSGLLIAQGSSTATGTMSSGTHKTTVKKHKKSTTKAVKGGGGGTAAKKSTMKHKKTTKSHAKPSSTSSGTMNR